MDREIILSSYDVKGEGNNTPQNFITKFNRPIILDRNNQYAVGLNKIINMSFTWCYDFCFVLFVFISDIPSIYLYFILWCAKDLDLVHVCNRSV